MLGNAQDAEECVNDALLAAWNSIPPNSPENLATYLGKLTRRICINKIKAQNSQKRICSNATVSIGELLDVLPDNSASPDEDFDFRELATHIENWLSLQKELTQLLFVARYWYCEQLSDISDKLGISQSKAKACLFRAKESLKKYLTKRGYFI